MEEAKAGFRKTAFDKLIDKTSAVDVVINRILQTVLSLARVWTGILATPSTSTWGTGFIWSPIKPYLVYGVIVVGCMCRMSTAITHVCCM